MNESGPIFVVGSPRSGTTLVAQLLSQHPNLFVYNETVFYDFISSIKNKKVPTNEEIRSTTDFLVNRINFTTSKAVIDNFGCVISAAEREAIIDLFNQELNTLDGNPALSQIFDIFMNSVATIKNASRWGEKTPNHVFHMKEIANDFPNAKFIHVIRDPRSFLKSYKYSWRMPNAKNPENARKLYHPYITSKLWNASAEAFQKAKSVIGEDKCIEVRYEDVLNDINNVMNDLFSFLGEKKINHIELPTGSNSSFRKTKADRLEQWEHDVCDLVCRQGIDRYNYNSNGVTLINYISMLRSFITLPSFAVQAWFVIRKRYKGNMFNYIKQRIT